MLREIVHGDIKAGNTLFDRKLGVNIIDYGFAKPIEDILRSPFNSRSGTKIYFSPELAFHKQRGMYSDLWATAIILASIWGLNLYDWCDKHEEFVLATVKER